MLFDHGTIAPSAIDLVRSGITFQGSISIFTPRPLHAAHADLLRRDGDSGGAAAAYERAIALTENTAQRAELQRRQRDLKT